MNKVQFATPYLLTSDGYREWCDIFDEDFQVRPVYVTEIDGNRCSLTIYNDDLTEELNGFAWVDIDDLIEYSLDRLEMVKTEIQEMIDDWDI